jgi:hypothetical protein
MRIHEILAWNNDPAAANRSNPEIDFSQRRLGDLTRLANAFTTRRGLVKYHWNLAGSEEEEPCGPAPPNGTELIPDGTMEPTTASWEAEPVPKERPVGEYPLVPLRQYRGVSKPG